MPTKQKTKKTRAPGHSTPAFKMPKNHCFGCGKDNAEGMHLSFFFDEEKMQSVSHFKLANRYQGPPGHAHGGIIAVILDEAMGKVNKLRNAVALTKTMKLNTCGPCLWALN